MTVIANIRWGLVLACCMTAAGPALAASAPAAPEKAKVPQVKVEPLVLPPAPFVEMVRALKATQNRLAFGDEAASKAAQEEMRAIRNWIEVAPPEAWQDRRNIRALAVYLLGGGSIGAGRQVFDDPKLDASDRDLISAVIAYTSGRFEESASGLEKIDTLTLEPILGAHVALAKATLMGERDPKKAFEVLTQSALLAPGTLMEEAALRRQIMLTAANPQIGSLARVVEVYVRRFDRSVFRRSLVDSILVALAKREFENKSEIETIMSAAKPLTGHERARIMLTLAESQIALGRLEMAKMTAEQALADAADQSTEKARAQLYDAVSSAFTKDHANTAAIFDGIDRSKLSVDDETLLEVTREGIRQVRAKPVMDANSNSDFKPVSIDTKARALIAVVDKLLHGG